MKEFPSIFPYTDTCCTKIRRGKVLVFLKNVGNINDAFMCLWIGMNFLF